MTEKTHYRKVFKSDHLGQADLEDFLETGSNLIFTITGVRQETNVAVAGRKGNFNIAYFQEKIKPLVLNATNSKTMKMLSGGSPFVEDWNDISVRLYIDPSVKMKGETVGGVRISTEPPVVRQVIDRSNRWDDAKNAYRRDGNFLKVLERADISEADQKAIIDEVAGE